MTSCSVATIRCPHCGALATKRFVLSFSSFGVSEFWSDGYSAAASRLEELSPELTRCPTCERIYRPSEQEPLSDDGNLAGPIVQILGLDRAPMVRPLAGEGIDEALASHFASNPRVEFSLRTLRWWESNHPLRRPPQRSWWTFWRPPEAPTQRIDADRERFQANLSRLLEFYDAEVPAKRARFDKLQGSEAQRSRRRRARKKGRNPGPSERLVDAAEALTNLQLKRAELLREQSRFDEAQALYEEVRSTSGTGAYERVLDLLRARTEARDPRVCQLPTPDWAS